MQHLAFALNSPKRLSVLKTQAGIGQPSLTQNPDANKKFYFFDAIWDTGAEGTVITTQVVKQLGLLPIDIGTNIGVDGVPREVNVYKIDLLLPNKVAIPNVRVSESPATSFQILIGMDIIGIGDFVVSNGNNGTHFSYCIPPHTKKLCLVERSEIFNKQKANAQGKSITPKQVRKNSR